MTDLHLHTCFSHDSEEDAENYILAARDRGITALGFSEHYDYDIYLNGEGVCALPDLEAYGKKLTELSQKYPDVKILKGIELGYSSDAVAHYKELLQSGKFDYSILSVHTVKGRGDCFFPRFYNGLSKKQAYGEYFKAVLKSVRSDISFCIAGHIGYVVRYAPYEDKRVVYSEFAPLIDEILREIISRDKCLEINTSAKGTGAITIPDRALIERYLTLGGKNFSLGSDAHSAQRLTENFSAVKKLLLSLGVSYTCRYEEGRLVKENL